MKEIISDYSKLKKNRLMHFQIGLILALGVALLCVNFTIDKFQNTESGIYDMPQEEIINIPITKDVRKKMPPPPVIKEVEPKDIIEDIDIDPEPEPKPVVNPSPTPNPVKPTLPGIPKPPSTPAKPVTPALPIVKPSAPPAPTVPPVTGFAEIMPRFKVLEDENATEDEIQRHADIELMNFIMKNVKYPAVARENGIEGTAVVRFIVEKDGTISGLEVLRDPGGGCGDAAMKVIKKMPKWERIGRQNGRSVRVFYTLPIRFKLGE